MRIACVYFPRFLIQVKLRKDPSLYKKPVAIYLPSEEIIEVSEEAQKAGAKKGISLKELRSLCPECIFIPFDEEEAEHMMEGLLETLFSITPLIERDEYLLFLDITHLNEEEVKRIRVLINDKSGLEANIGVASNKFVSRLASMATDDILIVPFGKETEFVKGLPIDYLPVNEDVRERFKILGLNKMEEIQILPPSFFYTYFGKKGTSIMKFSFGMDGERIKGINEKIKERIEITFDTPIESIKEVLSKIEGLLFRFDEKKAYPAKLRLIFRFIDKKVFEKELFIKEEQASKDVILLKIQTVMEKMRKKGPLLGITLIFSDYQRKKGTQLGLFLQNKTNLLSTIAFLRKKYGRDIIYEACEKALHSKVN